MRDYCAALGMMENIAFALGGLEGSKRKKLNRDLLIGGTVKEVRTETSFSKC